MDKFTIAALEATLNAYLENKIEKITTCHLLLKDKETLKKESQMLADLIPKEFEPKVIPTKSYSGGGAMPSHYLESFAVAIAAKDLVAFGLNEERLEKFLRARGIIARLENSTVLLDSRTLLEGDRERIAAVLEDLKNQNHKRDEEK